MKNLTRFVAFLVLFIAAVGFTLSYRALYEYGLANGINPDLAWLWPLITDGFMLVISLSILRASLLQEPTLYLWILAGIAIAVSIVFNIAHAPATLAGRAVAMIAPLAMFGSFEVFIGQVKRSAERNAKLGGLADIEKQYADKLKQLSDIDGKIADKQAKLSDMDTQIKDKRAEFKEITKQTDAAKVQLSDIQNDINYVQSVGPDKVTLRRDVVKMLSHYGAPLVDIASFFDVSQKTIERDLSYKNGHTPAAVRPAGDG